MKELLQVSEALRNRMSAFGKTIHKRQPYYTRLRETLHADFAKV